MKKQFIVLAVVLFVCGLIAIPASASSTAIGSKAAVMNCGGCSGGEKKEGSCQKKEGECKKDKDANGDCQKNKQEQKQEKAAEG